MKEISVFFLVFYRKIIKFAQYAIEMDALVSTKKS